VVFQSFKVFGQILAYFGSFGQFWADFAALLVDESMLKLKNLITFEP
jgi:succinate-acetate transporter protein